MKPSAYNFAIPTQDDGWLLFNARTGNLADLKGPNASRLVRNLIGEVDGEDIALGAGSIQSLIEKEFVLEDDFDELAAIRAVYWRARNFAPVVVTLTTTLDCNLGCFYCYEERSHDELKTHDLSAILAKIQGLLDGSSRKSLHVDWYGGEPMLNLPFLEAASAAIQALCLKLGVKFSASIISNGTSWPDDAEGFIRRHRIRQVQITFDGMRDYHNRRRRFTGSKDLHRSSFDESTRLVSKLVHVCRVDIRYNVDDLNWEDLPRFVEFARGQGWFEAEHQATFQPARVAAYTKKSRFVEKIGLSDELFDQLRRKAAHLLPSQALEEPESLSGYATPKTSVCAALSNHSVVFGADRKLYRCGLQVSESQRAVGSLQSGPFHILNHETDLADERWWAEFDPTAVSSCSRCSFLPVCLGGCPEKQLEQDQAALDAQSVYWRRNLARLICKTAEIPEVTWQFSERDQFRC